MKCPVSRWLKVLSLFLFFPPALLFSQASLPFKKMDSSYAALGIGREFAYFLSVREATSGSYILLKLPLDKNFGIEPVYCYYKKPAADYSVGTNAFIPAGGTEEYHDIRLNFLYYFWFMKNLQFKAGFNYSKFIRGNFIVDPSLDNCGTVMNMCRRSRENFYSFNIGLNLDLPVYTYILLMSNLTYRIFLSDNTTRLGALNFGVGVGLKLFSVSPEKSAEDDFSSRERPAYSPSRRITAAPQVKKQTERAEKKEVKKEENKAKNPQKAGESKSKTPVKREKKRGALPVQKEKKEEPVKPEIAKENKAEEKKETDQKTSGVKEKTGPEKGEAEQEKAAAGNTRTNTVRPAPEPEKELAEEEPAVRTNISQVAEKPVQETAVKKTNQEIIPPVPDIGISADHDEFSPDGDGVKDTISFIPETADPDRILEWKITVRDNQNNEVKSFSGAGALPRKIEWDGLDGRQAIIPAHSGFSYTLRVRDRLKREQETVPKQFRTGDYLVKQGNGFRITMENVLFDFNKYDIKAEFYPVLDRAFVLLQSDNFKERKVSIEGHTDNYGTEERNVILSQNRARAVMNYLIDKGLARERLSIRGFGETRPVASNETEEGRLQNRRTEIIIK